MSKPPPHLACDPETFKKAGPHQKGQLAILSHYLSFWHSKCQSIFIYLFFQRAIICHLEKPTEKTHISPYFGGGNVLSCLIFSLACKRGQWLNSEDAQVEFWGVARFKWEWMYECADCYGPCVTPSLVFTVQSVRTTPSNEAVTIDFKAVTLKAGESRYTKVASISFDGQ